MTWEAAYSKTTEGIEVSVLPVFLSERSDPADGLYVWAYKVRIHNKGTRTVTLRQRCWHITDADGRTEVVRGAGVVGEQPVLAPGESYEYTSGTPLGTPSGIMVGTYDMEVEGGDWLAVDIPAFSLDSPHEKPRLN
ncbi:Co2+/Mg2+ efflux protein ApaG [Sneathiella chinensis]|uniref:Protein ApaG n=1 Tax=Sneathiella chinensis TaxID=349750 RepID=A0ABQ5U0H2_9PROT|nr:Co2+/Mg2+ efflux protein ApaG [Sneathiella chinensis]GLQ05354.1 protein ApaG [Sneathiella chinensis]